MTPLDLTVIEVDPDDVALRTGEPRPLPEWTGLISWEQRQRQVEDLLVELTRVSEEDEGQETTETFAVGVPQNLGLDPEPTVAADHPEEQGQDPEEKPVPVFVEDLGGDPAVFAPLAFEDVQENEGQDPGDLQPVVLTLDEGHGQDPDPFQPLDLTGVTMQDQGQDPLPIFQLQDIAEGEGMAEVVLAPVELTVDEGYGQAEDVLAPVELTGLTMQDQGQDPLLIAQVQDVDEDGGHAEDLDTIELDAVCVADTFISSVNGDATNETADPLVVDGGIDTRRILMLFDVEALGIPVTFSQDPSQDHRTWGDEIAVWAFDTGEVDEATGEVTDVGNRAFELDGADSANVDVVLGEHANALLDSSGGGHHLVTRHGVPPADGSTSKFSGSVRLDGSEDRLENTDDAYAFEGAMAAFVAINPDSLAAGVLFQARQDGGGGQYAKLDLNADGTLTYSDTGGDTYTTTGSITAAFHGIVFERADNGDGTFDLRIAAVDSAGATVFDETNAGMSLPDLDGTSEVSIGAAFGGGSEYDGHIEEVRLWGATKPSFTTLLALADATDTTLEGTAEGNEVALWFLDHLAQDDRALDFTDISLSVSADTDADVAEAAELFTGDEFTVAFKYKRETTPASEERILGAKNDTGASNPGWMITVTSSGAIKVYYATGGATGTEHTFTSAANVADGEWHRISVDRERTSGTEATTTISVDGVGETFVEGDDVGESIVRWSTAAQFKVGDTAGSTSDLPFEGVLDEVRLLLAPVGGVIDGSAGDLANPYQADGGTRPNITDVKLTLNLEDTVGDAQTARVACWPFDQASGPVDFSDLNLRTWNKRRVRDIAEYHSFEKKVDFAWGTAAGTETLTFPQRFIDRIVALADRQTADATKGERHGRFALLINLDTTLASRDVSSEDDPTRANKPLLEETFEHL